MSVWLHDLSLPFTHSLPKSRRLPIQTYHSPAASGIEWGELFKFEPIETSRLSCLKKLLQKKIARLVSTVASD